MTLAAEHCHAPRTRVVDDAPHQAGLADAGFLDHQRRRPTLAEAADRSGGRGLLGLAPHQPRPRARPAPRPRTRPPPRPRPRPEPPSTPMPGSRPDGRPRARPRVSDGAPPRRDTSRDRVMSSPSAASTIDRTQPAGRVPHGPQQAGFASGPMRRPGGSSDGNVHHPRSGRRQPLAAVAQAAGALRAPGIMGELFTDTATSNRVGLVLTSPTWRPSRSSSSQKPGRLR